MPREETRPDRRAEATRAVAAAFALLGAACGQTAPSAAPSDAGAGVVDAGGACEGCDPVAPEGACPPGTAPRLGEAACVPVGWTTCAAGFAPDPSGWGCAAVLPAAACAGASREALGHTTCVPVGDCAAALPPPGLRVLFVDPGSPTDATHFRRIGEAIAAASAGATVAVSAGTYLENLVIERGITIVGRCAERVVVRAATQERPALQVLGATGVVIRGLTVTGATVGVAVDRADATLEDVVVEKVSGVGVDVVGRGGRLALVRSVVRDVGVVPGYLAYGAGALEGGALVLEDAAIVRATSAGVWTTDTGSTLAARGVVVRDTQLDENGRGGFGIAVWEGGEAVLARAAVLDAKRAGVSAWARTVLKGEDVEVRRTAPDGTGAHGIGVLAFDGARVDLTRVASVDNEGLGLRVTQDAVLSIASSVLRANRTTADQDLGSGAYVHARCRATFDGVAIVDNHRAGVEAFDEGTSVTIERSLVSGTRHSLGDKMGVGVEVAMGARAVVRASAIVDNRHSALFLWDGARATVEDTTLRGTQTMGAGELGHGVFALDSPEIALRGVDVRANAGIGLAFSASTAAIERSFVVDNAVGLHVQDGSSLHEVPEVQAPPAPNEIVVDGKTRFARNGSKLGGEAVPLPSPVKPPVR